MAGMYKSVGICLYSRMIIRIICLYLIGRIKRRKREMSKVSTLTAKRKESYSKESIQVVSLQGKEMKASTPKTLKQIKNVCQMAKTVRIYKTRAQL